MLKMQFPPIVDALGEAIETMAFISAMQVDPPDAGPGDALLCRIDFTGPARGTIEMIVGQPFAHLLCANMLACSPTDPEAAHCARDAVKELLNVICGTFLARLATPAAETFTVTLPSLTSFSSETQWRAFVASPAAATFDADGHTITIRVSEAG